MHSLPVEMQFKLLNIPYNNYKTQKCKFFENDKMCRFGKNCTYAHGPVDLRQPYEDLPQETIQKVTSELANKNAVLLAVNSAQQKTIKVSPALQQSPSQQPLPPQPLPTPAQNSPSTFVPVQMGFPQSQAQNPPNPQIVYQPQMQMSPQYIVQQQAYLPANLSQQQQIAAVQQATQIQQVQTPFLPQQQSSDPMLMQQQQQMLMMQVQGGQPFNQMQFQQFQMNQQQQRTFNPFLTQRQPGQEFAKEGEAETPEDVSEDQKSIFAGSIMYTAIPGENSVADNAAWM